MDRMNDNIVVRFEIGESSVKGILEMDRLLMAEGRRRRTELTYPSPLTLVFSRRRIAKRFRRLRSPPTSSTALGGTPYAIASARMHALFAAPSIARSRTRRTSTPSSSERPGCVDPGLTMTSSIGAVTLWVPESHTAQPRGVDGDSRNGGRVDRYRIASEFD